MGNLEAVRRGKWKLHFRKRDAEFSALYDLDRDISETTDMTSSHPEIVAELSALADTMRGRLETLPAASAGANAGRSAKYSIPNP